MDTFFRDLRYAVRQLINGLLAHFKELDRQAAELERFGIVPREFHGGIDLNQRRPGQSRYTTQRREPDEVKILSGVFEGQTTGTPISLLIENEDQRSKDYSEIKDKYRPGHADYTYMAKYGIRDYRGGGRSSARETATRVAAGAVARKILPEVTVRGALVQMGPHKIDRGKWDWDEIARNPFFCPDKDRAAFFEGYLDGIRKAGSSIGAVIEVVAEGVPFACSRHSLM